MKKYPIDVLGIGNAIVDIVSFVDHDQIADMGLVGGSMNLIDQEKAESLRRSVRPAARASGGSVANTVVCCAILGGSCKFIGKVGNDELGEKFSSDLREASVAYDTPTLDADMPTAQSYVFVTPDAQRTFCTYLGATTRLSAADFDPEAVRDAELVLIEGYLWDSPSSLELITETCEIAKRDNKVVAVSLSDPGLVERHRQALQDFVEEYVAVLFGNEHEVEMLYSTKGLKDTLDAISDKVKLGVVTRGAEGSCAIVDGRRYDQPAIQASSVVDTTGAGDAYAGGFLSEFVRFKLIPECMRTGASVAAKTVGGIGARPDREITF